MKKQISAIITAALIFGGLTACNKQDPESQSGAPNSVTDSVPDSSDDTSSAANENSSDNSTTENDPESDPVEKIRGIYGETEIPDVNWRDIDYNDFEDKMDYANAIVERNAMRLDSMVFETHESGDYKYSLVGKNVWVDTERSTDKIYANNLIVEVEKNGIKLNGVGSESYMHEVLLYAPYGTSTVLKDKIGSYLDVYEMDVPVIVMKYYFDYDFPGAVNDLMMFATVQENELQSHFFCIYGEGTRPFIKYVEPGTGYYTMDGGDPATFVHPFGEGKFKIADGKTLIDEDEGIKYTFDFSDPMLAERYTAEKIV